MASPRLPSNVIIDHWIVDYLRPMNQEVVRPLSDVTNRSHEHFYASQVKLIRISLDWQPRA